MNIDEIMNTVKKYINVAVKWERTIKNISEAEKNRITCLSESKVAMLNNHRNLSYELAQKAADYESEKDKNNKELVSLEVSVSDLHQEYQRLISHLNTDEISTLHNAINNDLSSTYDKLNVIEAEKNVLYSKVEEAERDRDIERAEKLRNKLDEKYEIFSFLTDSIKFYKTIALDLHSRLIRSTSEANKRTY